MQLLIGAGFAGVAFTLPVNSFFAWSLAMFWLVAFSSATHDIAADGYYMLALNEEDQAFFVGIRSTFYRIATIAGQGLLVILAGELENRMDVNIAWSITFYVLAALFIGFFVYHRFILPKPLADKRSAEANVKNIVQEFFGTFVSFFRKKHAWIAILFMLLYRLPEAQLVKIINPFLLDPIDKGGLGLTTSEVGMAYGTVGIIGLTIGGIIGGICASIGGLRRWLWPMALSLVLPNLVYILLSFYQPQNMFVISLAVFVEQFGYGFGFTAYMLYLIHYSRGNQATAHYAICTAFMALGMMLPGMIAGWLQEMMGYTLFFCWIMVCCIATLIACALIKKYDL